MVAVEVQSQGVPPQRALVLHHLPLVVDLIELTLNQLIYQGRAEGWLVVASLEPG